MSALYRDRDGASAAAEKLKVFAQPQRLMILSCLLRGERNVGEIAEATGIGQPALSQQLAELRRADLVRTRRHAKQVRYALADDGVSLCVRTMESIFGGVPGIVAPDVTAAPEPPPPGVAGFARIL
ncbi:MAG: transcriptional regulator [Alphaproteobacteria bacterium 65-7]|nr:MAG: transcriptional regulator [Alphaproteobacteria bacterium 65-7]